MLDIFFDPLELVRFSGVQILYIQQYLQVNILSFGHTITTTLPPSPPPPAAPSTTGTITTTARLRKANTADILLAPSSAQLLSRLVSVPGLPISSANHKLPLIKP